MAHIQVPEGVSGIRSLAMFRPETGKPLYDLAQVLLRGESPLTEGERELIAAYVSSLNNCIYCMSSHAAAARCLFGDEKKLISTLLLKNLDAVTGEEYTDKRVVVKGCGEVDIPETAYVEITKKLRPFAKSIMYGEACSAVPLYKKGS